MKIDKWIVIALFWYILTLAIFMYRSYSKNFDFYMDTILIIGCWVFMFVLQFTEWEKCSCNTKEADYCLSLKKGIYDEEVKTIYLCKKHFDDREWNKKFVSYTKMKN